MKTATLFLTTAFGLAVMAAAQGETRPPREISHDRLVGIERAIEPGTSVTLLPTSPDGTITVNMCANCRSERLQVTARTRYFAGRTPVSFAEFKSLIDPGHPAAMTVFADLKDPVAVRIVLDVAPPARSKNR